MQGSYRTRTLGPVVVARNVIVDIGAELRQHVHHVVVLVIQRFASDQFDSRAEPRHVMQSVQVHRGLGALVQRLARITAHILGRFA